MSFTSLSGKKKSSFQNGNKEAWKDLEISSELRKKNII